VSTIGGGRGMGRRPAAAMPQAEDEDSLYFIVRTGRVSLQQTVDDWIEEYKVRIIGRHTHCIYSNRGTGPYGTDLFYINYFILLFQNVLIMI
jgi:hypothetical protein